MALFLTAVTDKLQVITGQAVNVDVHVSWADVATAGTGSVATGRTNTAITTAATTDVMPAPAASTTRTAKLINIRNKSAASTVDITVQFNANGTIAELWKVTLKAGETLIYLDAVGWYVAPVLASLNLLKALSADATGTDVATAQPWFPTAGGVTVLGDALYFMSGILHLSRAAGVVSHTTGILFAGTATLTSIAYIANAQVGETDALLPDSRVTSNVATNTLVKAASTTASEQTTVEVDGLVRISAAGTFIPQFIFSAAPGGVPTIQANSFFRLDYIGAGGFVSQGTWA